MTRSEKSKLLHEALLGHDGRSLCPEWPRDRQDLLTDSLDTLRPELRRNSVGGPDFDPERLGFLPDSSGDQWARWTYLVSRYPKPHVRVCITCRLGRWEIVRYVNDRDRDEEEPLGETSFTGLIPSHRFGCELLVNMGFPEEILDRSSSA